MKISLNLLTQDEIDDLENFIKSKIKKDNKHIQKFLDDLRLGKLKNKHIEVEALDFICEGLTDIVEAWENGKEEIGEIERVVCAKNTRVGKFLNTYNKKQISLREGINILKRHNVLEEAINGISYIYARRNCFKLGDHDITHTQRVLLNAAMIMNLRKELSERERKIIFTAIIHHDIGRIHDYEDKYHGERAVQNFTDELDEFTDDEQDLIKFIIIQHCTTNSENEMAIASLNKTEEEKQKYSLFLNYVKDADMLDRVRFPEIIPMLSDALNPERLYFDESKRLIKFACESLENTDFLFNIKNNKSKEDLFSREKIFAEVESGKELVESVYKILRENGYPERSKNLRLNKIKQHNSRFIKDGYLYLLRGDKQGQKSGFFSYPYSKEKKNIEQYLKENSSEDADFIATQQSLKGRERFISTTTDISIAAEHTDLDLDRNISGSLYIVRVKPQDAFRIISPIGLKEFYGTEEDHDENEYLIPDFIDPEEVIKEFEYNDYVGVYEFLRNEIGLNIEKSDIRLKENIKEQPELSDEFLNYIRKRNEMSNKYWENTSGGNNTTFQEMTKIITEGKGNTVLEKMINALFDPYDDTLR